MMKESKAFLRIWIGVGLLWPVAAYLLFKSDSRALRSFFLAYQAVVLDLFFLVVLFWELFFSAKPVRKMRVFLYFTFKLVCLGFLAITLKRLRNDSPLPSGFAVLFMGIGPLISAVFLKWSGNKT